jgi:7-carboxy-7-deazaguanine synthase
MLISEIFKSIQGESSFAGLPCVFIRTAGCDVKCAWCDTVYARGGGVEMSIEEVVAQAKSYNNMSMVELTGGEPLMQSESLELLNILNAEFKTVLLETSGAYPIGGVHKKTHIIMDVKCPSSGASDRIIYDNFRLLRKKDEIKLVIADKVDFDFAITTIKRYNLFDCAGHVIMSPVFGRMEPAALARLILDSGLPIRMQIQLHKIIWPNVDRGV